MNKHAELKPEYIFDYLKGRDGVIRNALCIVGGVMGVVSAVSYVVRMFLH